LIEIMLPMPPSANRIWRSARGRVFRSAEYDSWEKSVLWLIRQATKATFQERVDVSIELPCKGRGDADNRIKPVMDALVHAGVLKGDSKKYVRGVQAFWSDEDLGECIRVKIVPVASAYNETTKAEGQRDGAHPNGQA